MIAWRQNSPARAVAPTLRTPDPEDWPVPNPVVRPAFVRPAVLPLPGTSFAAILTAVEAHYNIAPGSLIRGSRAFRFVHPRQLAMYLCRTITDRPYTEIGQAFGGRDHSTVIHAMNAVEARLAIDPAVRTAYQAIVEALEG